MLPLILALAGGYLIYEGLEDQPKKMASGGEIPASEVKVGDIVYLKIDSLRTRGSAYNPKYYYGNKDVKAIIHKISVVNVQGDEPFYIFQISKSNNKGEEVKLPQGQLGIAYMRNDFYYPEEKKMAEGGMTDKDSKEMINVLTQIKSDFDYFKPELMNLSAISVDKDNSMVTAQFTNNLSSNYGQSEPKWKFVFCSDGYNSNNPVCLSFINWAKNFNWYPNVEIGFYYADINGGRIYKFRIKVISLPKIEPKKAEPKEEQTWTIRYISSEDNDAAAVWVYGRNKDEAIENAKDEYWDIDEIISVTKMADGGMTENLKVGDIVVEYKNPNPNQSKREIGGQGKIISISNAMAKVEYENNYEEWIPLKDLKNVAESKKAMGVSIDDQMKDAMSKRDAIEKEIRQLMTEEPKDFDKIEALKHEYDSLGKAYKKLNKQKLDEMRGGLKFK
jgi:hypothetical protein